MARVRSKYPHLVPFAFGDSPILEVTEDFWKFDYIEATILDEYEGCLPTVQTLINQTAGNYSAVFPLLFEGREDMLREEFINFLVDLIMWAVN